MLKSYRGVEQGLARWAHNPKVGGSNPSPAIFGGIAQLVEQRNHNPCVVGSSPTAAIQYLKKSFIIKPSNSNYIYLIIPKNYRFSMYFYNLYKFIATILQIST